MTIACRRLTGLLAVVPLLAACITVNPFGSSNNRGQLNLEVIEPGRGFFTTDEILLLPLSGLVTTGDLSTGFDGTPGMLVALKDRLDAARRNPRIRIVVLRIDSPGGTVTASDLIHREIVRFKEETGLPVIAQLGDTAASGAVYIAMAADEIYALPTTVTGSIGVVAIYPNLEGLIGKLGVGVNVIKAGAMKDAGSPWRSMTDPELEVFQTIVDGMNERFRCVIVDSRADKGLTSATLEQVADGRILTPEQAIKANLIDGVRYHEQVIERARQLAGLPDAAVVSYEYPYQYRGNILARGGRNPARAEAVPSTTFNLLSIGGEPFVRELFGARFLYMWMP
jgi:protease-4